MSIGNSKDSLGDRMKSYEELSTSRQLMPNCPVYARIDGRAFHTLCKG
jgi:tRNA(His) 5'-end guanylyltransferase